MPELPPYDPARARAHLMELERRRRREENQIRAELRRLRADIRNPFAQAENLQEQIPMEPLIHLDARQNEQRDNGMLPPPPPPAPPAF